MNYLIAIQIIKTIEIRLPTMNLSENLFDAFLMGLVEGATEFLPVSSTGHLILLSHILDLDSAKYEIIIQAGAILAAVCLYFSRFLELLFPYGVKYAFLRVVRRQDDTIKEFKQTPKPFSGVRGLFLLFLTSFPAAFLGLLFHSYIKLLFSLSSVLFFLVLGALFMLYVENRHKDTMVTVNTVDEVTPKQALYIGFFQILALMPGFSRSASTIMGGLYIGLSRKTAAEYSFLAAVPIILAAAAYDLLKSYGELQLDDLNFIVIATLFSFIFALLAIKFFISFVSHYSFKVFAYYRIILASLLFCYFYIIN